MQMDKIRPIVRSMVQYILPLFLLCLFAGTSPSQQVTLDPPQIAPVDLLTVNDLDFLNATTPKWIFTITIRSNQPVQAVMGITINIMLTDGSRFPEAVSITTDPFDVVNARTITNIDLTNGNPRAAEHVVRDDAKTRLEETALPGGRIPAGLYQFVVTVTPEGGTPVSVTFDLEPSNPSSIQLLFPQDGDENASEFQLFQWHYDGSRSRISVYEQLPGQITPEEVISGVPHLTDVVETNSFQYPSSGVRALQPGKTYVWTIEGLAGISGGGDAVLRSELRTFRVSTRNAPWISGILAEIEQAVGPDHAEVFNRIRREGLTTDGTMSLNGTLIAYNDLVRLLERLREKPGSVRSVVIE